MVKCLVFGFVVVARRVVLKFELAFEVGGYVSDRKLTMTSNAPGICLSKELSARNLSLTCENLRSHRLVPNILVQHYLKFLINSFEWMFQDDGEEKSPVLVDSTSFRAVLWEDQLQCLHWIWLQWFRLRRLHHQILCPKSSVFGRLLWQLRWRLKAEMNVRGQANKLDGGWRVCHVTLAGLSCILHHWGRMSEFMVCVQAGYNMFTQQWHQHSGQLARKIMESGTNVFIDDNSTSHDWVVTVWCSPLKRYALCLGLEGKPWWLQGLPQNQYVGINGSSNTLRGIAWNVVSRFGFLSCHQGRLGLSSNRDEIDGQEEKRIPLFCRPLRLEVPHSLCWNEWSCQMYIPRMVPRIFRWSWREQKWKELQRWLNSYTSSRGWRFQGDWHGNRSRMSWGVELLTPDSSNHDVSIQRKIKDFAVISSTRLLSPTRSLLSIIEVQVGWVAVWWKGIIQLDRLAR